MPDVYRGGPRSLVGQEFYEIEELGAFSFCPDSNDASTPATQVHMQMQLQSPLFARKPPPMIARFHGTNTLDALIEALIEHRTYVFGRREWDASKYPEQEGVSKLECMTRWLGRLEIIPVVVFTTLVVAGCLALYCGVGLL